MYIYIYIYIYIYMFIPLKVHQTLNDNDVLQKMYVIKAYKFLKIHCLARDSIA
jgi:hypothetical protein